MHLYGGAAPRAVGVECVVVGAEWNCEAGAHMVEPLIGKVAWCWRVMERCVP